MESDDERYFAVVDSCLRNIKEQMRMGGLRASPAAARYLTEEPHHTIVLDVSKATCKNVKHLVSRGNFNRKSLLALGEPPNPPKQGVYANIATNQNNTSDIRIYVGAAAGPYNSPRSRGMIDRIRWHEAQIRQNKGTTVLHYKILRMPGWCSCWAALVIFDLRVSKQLVIIAQTIMAIIFGSCLSQPYDACRPMLLAAVTPGWGLNEVDPLNVDSLASYNKIHDGMNSSQVELIRGRLHAASQAFITTHHKRRLERARNGGLIHVNVLIQNGEIKRFFISPMAASDGSHIDITIPLSIGLHYGLHESRAVKMTLDLSTRNHHTPFASKATYNTDARRLGLLIEGQFGVGPKKGAHFSYWVQSKMRAAIIQAEKLINFVSNDCSDGVQGIDRERARPSRVEWTCSSFLSKRPLPGTQDLPASEPSRISSSRISLSSEREEGVLYEVILQILKAVKLRVLSRKMRVCPTTLKYFQGNSLESIANNISQAVRPATAGLILSTTPFTPSTLLSIGGNIRDRHQGVYADVVTNEDPDYFKIYVGSSASTLGGLSRRIREHLSFVRSPAARPESGSLHSIEIKKPGSRTNFVILARFTMTVDRPLVHIAEGVMTILFASWNNPALLFLRPVHLAKSDKWGLNNANPMDFAIPCHYPGPNTQKWRILASQNRAASMQERGTASTKAGGAVHIWAYLVRRRYWKFSFSICGEKIYVPSALGTSLGLHKNRVVNVECDLRTEQHPLAYAKRARWKSTARRLGICLKGQYQHGPCKGQSFEKWIQCESEGSVLRAEKIVGVLDS